MGISNDIRPKRQHYSPMHHHTNDESHFNYQKTEKVEDPPADDKKNELEQLEKPHRIENVAEFEHEFFRPEKDRKPEKDKGQEPAKKKHTGRKILFSIVFIAVIVYAAYQAYQKSQSLYGDIKSGTNTATSTDNDQYSGEVITQDNTTAQSGAATTATQTEAQSSTITEVATTTAPVIDKTTIKLSVLNGNGIRNSAAGVKTTLTTAGFTVSNLTIARNFSYLKTYIYYHTGKEAEANLVKDALPDREVILELSDTVATSYDVVVVVGKN